MNRGIVIGAIAATMVLPSTVLAASTNWYVTAGAGQATVKDLSSEATTLSNDFTALGITNTVSVDDNNTAYHVTLGYSFNKYFAAEAGYVDFKSATADYTITAPSAATAQAEWTATGWTLEGVGSYPFGNGFSVYGKLGMIAGHEELKISASSGSSVVTGKDTESDTEFTYGAGAAYDFNDMWGLRLGYQIYSNLGDANKTGESDVDMWSLAVRFNF